ncbi:carbohydrate kinase family protein [Cellulomonas sp. McL0617]|uniref:carbohydrate kinase family protein n=1 Tax=Cellulomonas sp. McL0617 TaxID=3415675 RepID=UPI003CF231C1
MKSRALVPAVLVAGDANVDLVLRGDVVPRFGQAEQLVSSDGLVLGGSASIVACGLARLGVPTSLVARVGDDALGQFQLDALRAAGVGTSQVEVDPSTPTGLSVILSAADDRAILTVPGTIPTLRASAVRTALAATGARHLHVASYFLQPTLAAELPVLLAEVRASGVTVSLDTNWDPADAWDGVLSLLPLVDVLLPNLSELRALGAVAGATGSDLEVAHRLASFGPRVVVKAGADGGWSVGAGFSVQAPGLPVDVVDTTGAGDSFDAGYLAAVAHGIDDEGERLRWATVAGSLSTLEAGGTGRQATLDDLR